MPSTHQKSCFPCISSLLFYNCAQKLASLRGLSEPLEPFPVYAPDLTGFRAIRPVFLRDKKHWNLLFGLEVHAARLMINCIGRCMVFHEHVILWLEPRTSAHSSFLSEQVCSTVSLVSRVVTLVWCTFTSLLTKSYDILYVIN